MFADGMNGAQVAAALEVSTKSAYAWRRTWMAGGERALASKGAPGPDLALSPELVRKLIAKLDEGPAATGWTEDQRWTLARVRTLIGRMFHRTSRSAPWQRSCTGPATAHNSRSPGPPNVTSPRSSIGGGISGRR
jgi:transposase